MKMNRRIIKRQSFFMMLSRVSGIVLAVLIVAMATYWSLRFIEDNRERKIVDERNTELGLIYDEVAEEDKNNHVVDGADKPKSLTIADAGINNSRIQEIGLLQPNENGSQQMDAPQNVHDVGWYNCQINPVVSKRCTQYVSPMGMNNTSTAAVMDGHSCGRDGCVFDGLQDLYPGSEIEITMGDNSVVTYIVDYVEYVDLADLDMSKVMTAYNEGRPGLNLITCSGEWSAEDSRGIRTMNQRIVVYSTMKE